VSELAFRMLVGWFALTFVTAAVWTVVAWLRGWVVR
jgi:hypothetical protein